MAGDAGWGQLKPAGELLTKDLGPTELTSGLTCNYGKHLLLSVHPLLLHMQDKKYHFLFE